MIPLIVDAHCDLAWNMLNFGRDYTRSASETRAVERGSMAVQKNGDTLLGWPDYQRGRVAIVFSTLFAAPNRTKEGTWDKLCYGSPEEAHHVYRAQLDAYHRLAESQPRYFRMIGKKRELDEHVKVWQDTAEEERPVGLVILMEGAEGIRSVDELPEWHELGLRLIGLSWGGTRYAGGTREPGPLTPDGRQLLEAMAELGFVLDLSHMDEQAAREALDMYEGPIVATHVNCLALLPDFPTNRHFSDELMRAIVERDGIVGSVPFNNFLKSGWSRRGGSRRDEVPLDRVAAHIDHVCQLAGDALHAGIGSDFDGGFGLESTPPEIDTVADLQKLVPLLTARGYSEADVAQVMGLNWLRCLREQLPG
jgi:membrane dipeptidase